MTSVVYPYINSTDGDEELRFSMRSLCANLVGEFDIWVIGDAPKWYKGNFIHIPRFRERAVDIHNKLRAVIAESKITNDFIYIYDDLHILKKINISWFSKPVAKYKVIPNEKLKRSGSPSWMVMLERTLKALNIDEKWNYETHLPRMLNKRKLEVIFDTYNLRAEGLLFNTLYWNEYCDKPEIDLSIENGLKLFIQTGDTYVKTMNQYNGQVFLNSDHKAFTHHLKGFLNNMFKEKCKFEK